MSATMTTPETETTSPSRRKGQILFAMVGGAAIFVFGTPYLDLSQATNDNPVFNGTLTVGLGLLAWTLRRRDDAYSAVAFTLFVAAIAMWALVIGPFNWLITERAGTPQGELQDKAAQFLAVVPPILVVMALARRSRQSLYLTRGDSRRWLRIGLPAVAVGAAAYVGIATSLGYGFDAIVSTSPWLLGYATLNAVMEELWFRGVFLQSYIEHLGPTAAIAVTALVFGGPHLGAAYLDGLIQIPFGLLVIGFGVLLAWIIRSTRSIWGAVVFHIGMDLIIIFEVVDTL